MMVKGVQCRKMAEKLAVVTFEIKVRRLHAHGLKKPRRTSDVLGDRHVVVIENNNKRLAAHGGVGKPLEGKASRHGSVADHGAYIIILAGERSGMRHTKRYRHGV